MNEIQKHAPVSLRISITDRCQHRCLYCMGPDGVDKFTHQDILSFTEIIRFVGVLKRRFGLGAVRITGGEPLVRRGVVELVKMLAAQGLSELTLTTNSQFLAAMAGELKQAGLNRVNISLDSINPDTYRRLTRGGELEGVLAGLAAALVSGLAPVKLNTVVLKGINSDEVVNIARFAIERHCEVRFLELMPIGPADKHFADWFVSSQEVLAKLWEAFELEPARTEPGSSSRKYLARDAQGRKGSIGLISSVSSPFCRQCRRLRLTSTGKLIGCLARPEGPNIRRLLQDAGKANELSLVEMISEVLDIKGKRRLFWRAEPMVRIGG